MCNCKGDIHKTDIARTIWTGYNGIAISGYYHIDCGKRLSNYQLAFKVK